ncbi:MAG: ribosome maturation factor RimM [Haliea sp.]|jgi:16S rRNA processing protein RimM|uniref:ribosome maturation factor RimM n=1 Tax=Haliea sp. TaxID=1932666 RepID=UPI000C36F3A8|nr:ribosome maturation factor RimM [Haliea sp.]MBM68668.1 ribosome maturation factor RimM [Haliea sp.]|tara:strand:- start:6252 stop:6791 length:540 start_codon:yes stop_codon:yes gene_type:complete
MNEAARERLVIGRITGCYGIKGWVRIHSFTEPMENFLEFKGVKVQRRGGYEAIEFDQGRRQGKGLVAHIRGVDDRDLAETFQGLEVSVDSDALPELEEGDYYWHQLQGLQVWCHTDNGQVLLGAVDYLIETGANDVLVVKPCEGSIDQRERLIPWLPGTTVRQVDVESGRIDVDWFPED